MISFTRDMLYKIVEDFQQELERIDKFCILKDLRFNSGNIPDYSVAAIQQLYLLRYLPAYMLEYYIIYDELLDDKFLELPWNILSIGVGCGIDYYGLKFALEDKSLNLAEYIYYTGVDRINWMYKDSYGNKDCHFIIEDISLWRKLPDDAYNLIIFPKSIGEFDHSSFAHLKSMLKHTSFTNRKICLVCSLRAEHDAIDVNRFEDVTTTFVKEHGYESLDEPRMFTRLREDVGLKSLYPNHFDYPNGVKDLLITLATQCHGYTENNRKNCDSDCQYLSKWPILRSKYIEYQIKRLTRD